MRTYMDEVMGSLNDYANAEFLDTPDEPYKFEAPEGCFGSFVAGVVVGAVLF